MNERRFSLPLTWARRLRRSSARKRNGTGRKSTALNGSSCGGSLVHSPKRVMVSISRLVCPLPRLLATSFLRSRHQYLVGVRVDNKCNIGLSWLNRESLVTWNLPFFLIPWYHSFTWQQSLARKQRLMVSIKYLNIPIKGPLHVHNQYIVQYISEGTS